jgi:opacity protein-like surface antigen
MKTFILFFIALTSTSSYAADVPSIRPSGIMGFVGAGFVHFDVQEPLTQNFKIDDGVFAAIGGERALFPPSLLPNIYLTMSINYLKSKGDTKYNYTTTSGTTNYSSANVVPFDMSLFQAGLGLKVKIFEYLWVHPFVEAGGIFGYMQTKYTNLVVGSNVVVSGADTGIKREDSLFDLGYYGEAGLEMNFSSSFALKASYRETRDKTKPFETLADKKVEYKSQVYCLSLLKTF